MLLLGHAQEGLLEKHLFEIDHLRFDDQSDQSGIATRSEAGERVKKLERQEKSKKKLNATAFWPPATIVGQWRDISN